MSISNSNRHTVPVALGDLPLPKGMDEYVSTGFVGQNNLMLEMLTTQNSDKSHKLTASVIFLSMVFPKLQGPWNTVIGNDSRRPHWVIM